MPRSYLRPTTGNAREAINAIQATAAEINQALDGIGASVTAANLTDLVALPDRLKIGCNLYSSLVAGASGAPSQHEIIFDPDGLDGYYQAALLEGCTLNGDHRVVLPIKGRYEVILTLSFDVDANTGSFRLWGAVSGGYTTIRGNVLTTGAVAAGGILIAAGITEFAAGQPLTVTFAHYGDGTPDVQAGLQVQYLGPATSF